MLRQYFLDLLNVTAVNHDSFLLFSIIVFGAPGSVKEASKKSLTETLTLHQIM